MTEVLVDDCAPTTGGFHIVMSPLALISTTPNFITLDVINARSHLNSHERWPDRKCVGSIVRPWAALA